MYGSTPPLPANIFVNKLSLVALILTPTRGCIIPWPSITLSSFFESIGLFKICAIAPISSSPVFRVSSVSASKVIIYLIFTGSPFIFFSFLKFSKELTLNGFSSFPNKYSLN